MKNKIIPYLLLIPQFILSGLFIAGLINAIMISLGIMPSLGLNKLTFDYYIKAFLRKDLFDSLTFSFYTALVSALISTVLGVFICYFMINTKRGISWIVELPIITPHVVTALFIISIFSQNGFIARLLFMFNIIKDQQEFPVIVYNSGGIGIILGYIWKEVPFVIYFTASIMSNINEKLGDAAANLGAGAGRIFFEITLPLCKNTIISAFLIIFVFSLGAYELPFLLGATKPKALPVQAYEQYLHPDLRNRPYAMALNGIIIAAAMLSAVFYYFVLKSDIDKKLKN